MDKFEFYHAYKELATMKNIKAGDPQIEKLISTPESCIGHRKVGDRTYHIFYLHSCNFSVYYHGGGVDSMYSSDSLDIVLDYVNSLTPEKNS